MKVCKCGQEMEFTKFMFQYVWVCPECESVEDVDDSELDDGDLYGDV